MLIYNRYVKLYENSNVLNKKIVDSLRPIQINGSDKDSDTTRLIYTTKKAVEFRHFGTSKNFFSFENFPRVRADRGQSGTWAQENYYEKLFSKIYDYFFYDEG